MASTVAQPGARQRRTGQPGTKTRRGRALAGGCLLALLLALGPGCDEGDAVSVKVVVAADFSGTVSLSRLSIPAEPTEAEGLVTGVSWEHRAELTCSTGRFGDVGELVLADMRFTHGLNEDGHTHLRVELPRGAAARWPGLLTVTAAGPRRSALSALDPTGRINEVGDNLRLELRLPATVATHGVLPADGKLTAESERDEASLVIPLEVAQTEGPPLVWTVTWEH